MLTEDQARAMLIQARKRGAIRDYAIIGKDGDASQNVFDSQQAPPTGTGELNTVYARINGNPDPQTVYYSPDQDMRIIAHGARVLIKWIDGQPWIDGADKVYLTQQQNGAPLPTHNFPLRIHDHTSDTEGGSLGADTVDTTQLVDDAVTTAKIDALAVTSAELASNAVTTDKITDANVTLAKMASNSVDTAQLVDDAVIPTKTDGLSGASTALVTQTASDTFSSILYNHTATSAPTTGDDTGDGYSVGSSWLDVTNDRSYQALDVTASNAVWRETSNPTYFYENVSYSGTTTTSGTTTLVVIDETLTATGFDASKRYTIVLDLMFQGSVAGDLFQIFVGYNYDNAGSEAFTAFTRIIRFNIQAASANLPVTQVDIYNGVTASNTWGYSGAYKVRCQIVRVSGTGTATVNLSFSSLQVVEI